MKCPENTVRCKVRTIRHSKAKYGSRPTPQATLFKCEFHGYFMRLNDKDAFSGFLGHEEEPDIEPHKPTAVGK